MAASGSQCDSPRLSALMSIAPTLPEHSTGALWPPSDMLGHAMLVFDLLLLGGVILPKNVSLLQHPCAVIVPHSTFTSRRVACALAEAAWSLDPMLQCVPWDG